MRARDQSEKIKSRYVKAVTFIVNDSGKKESEIVEDIGFTVSNFIRMKMQDYYPTIEQCALLCQKHNFNGDWLLTGRGNMNALPKKIPAVQLLKLATNAVAEELTKVNRIKNAVNKKNKI